MGAASSVPAASADDTSHGGMRGGISFRTFPLVARETLSAPGAASDVIRLTFGLSDPNVCLGFEQPTTHIKVQMPRDAMHATSTPTGNGEGSGTRRRRRL